MTNSMLSNAKITLKTTIPINIGAGHTFKIFEKGYEVDGASIVLVNKAQLERMQVDIDNQGVCTIVRRGLDNSETKISDDSLKCERDIGSTGYITVLASDIIDKDSYGTQEVNSKFVFKNNIEAEGKVNLSDSALTIPVFSDNTERDNKYTNPIGGEICSTNGDLQIYNQETNQWETMGVSTPTPDATEVAKGRARLATKQEAIDGLDDETIMTPKKVNDFMFLTPQGASLVEKKFLLGENVKKNDYLFKEDMVKKDDINGRFDLGKSESNKKIAIKGFGSGESGDDIDFFIEPQGSPTQRIKVRVETEGSNGKPSGVLVDENAEMLCDVITENTILSTDMPNSRFQHFDDYVGTMFEATDTLYIDTIKVKITGDAPGDSFVFFHEKVGLVKKQDFGSGGVYIISIGEVIPVGRFFVGKTNGRYTYDVYEGGKSFPTELQHGLKVLGRVNGSGDVFLMTPQPDYLGVVYEIKATSIKNNGFNEKFSINKGDSVYTVLSREDDGYNSSSYYKVGFVDKNSSTRDVYIYGEDYEKKQDGNFIYLRSNLLEDSILAKTNAQFPYKISQDGLFRIAQIDGGVGDIIPTTYFGKHNLFNGLDVDKTYYISDTPGKISTTKGTYECVAGIVDYKDTIFINRFGNFIDVQPMNLSVWGEYSDTIYETYTFKASANVVVNFSLTGKGSSSNYHGWGGASGGAGGGNWSWDGDSYDGIKYGSFTSTFLMGNIYTISVWAKGGTSGGGGTTTMSVDSFTIF